jgi:cell division protein FtsN
VIVPGFGAIIARRIPAQHFLSSHTIYPPKRGLSFNSQITQSDGLLENHVASMKSIPYEDARLEVATYVQELSQEIEEHGTATLYKIGRFYRNADHKLEFTPMYVLNYLSEAFGLGTQELYAIDREQQEEIAAVAEPAVDQTPVIPIAVEKTESTVSEPEKTEETPLHKERTPWLRYAATAVILLGMGYLGFTGYENRKQEESIAIEQKAEDRLKVKVQEANIFISAPLPSIELTAAPQVKNFHIVAGAFREPENATKRVGQLQRKGFNSRVIGVNKYGLHNVTFESYATREEALVALSDLKQKGYATAWLLSGNLESK